MEIKKSRNKIPPDGGWGWMIVFAQALSSMVSLPILTAFGLIFKDKLSGMGMPVKDISTITSTNSACSMLIGVVNGPLLKNFGYRKVALTAGLMFTTGIALTAFANNFCQFILSYSILTASGFGLINSSFSLALNTYFRKKRSRAAGTSVTITGLGPVLYPPLITVLLSYYGVQDCVLILACLSLHVVVAALLLQPIKYHLIHQPTDEELAGLNDTSNAPTEAATLKPNGIDSNITVGQTLAPIPNAIENNSMTDKMNELERYRFFGFDNSMDRPNELRNGTSYTKDDTDPKLATSLKNVSPEDETQPPPKTSMLSGVVRIFDLDLLKDLRFINIIAGTAIATFAELSFGNLIPFILSDMTFSNIEIATFLSTQSIADIASRFLSPFIGDYLAIPTRVMYLVGLSLLIVFRTSVLLCDNLTKLLIIAACIGVAKGIRTVYIILVIPNYVTINKLASALGIRMVSNGLVVLCLGPLVGWIRDFTGSYVICIVFMNCLTLTCIIMWGTEILYYRFKYKPSKKV
ncbi:monocarboxylate transporter 13-like isoform X1 [Bradysia coprophila]|uniref:monocarboxylate transporter 13-like isoform X1 n=1 Tax=Bradysia coprophila TaxID=38358 RepID=UPI00187D7FD4|nr:monocarboxylate transporter 13-like isoform X1 [Bradysia coprophila]XP_037028598.1 monocarboxylate transporter 13-like isoform X1 [Bradysia coprophila]